MTPMDAAALVLLLFLPLNWLVLRHFDRLEDPRYLCRHGIVVLSEGGLDGHAETVGDFMGQPIWGTVTFKGMVYRFDHVATPREAVRPGELRFAHLVYALRKVD